MDATQSPSAERLCAEILADARRQSDAMLSRADAEARTITEAATAEADKLREERGRLARAAAAHRKETILATVAVESERLRSARIEELLQTIHDGIRQRLLAAGADARSTVTALAAEVLRHSTGRDFVVKISPADLAAFGEPLGADLVRLAGRGGITVRICAEETVTGGGVIIESADGFQVWDNRLPSRLRRLWPELRRQIARRLGLVTEIQSTSAGSS